MHYNSFTLVLFRSELMSVINFNMRLDSELKEQVTPILEDYGLTMPQAFKLFLNQIVKTKTVPLSFDYAKDQPNAVTQKAMPEALSRVDFSENYESVEKALLAIHESDNA